MTDPDRVDELLTRFVAAQVSGVPLDPASLCGEDRELLAALLARIASYQELDELLSTHRRLSAGRSLGRYRILGEIGRGAMGIVYLAERADGGRVALKLFPPERKDDAELLARFEREARVIRRLDHPNVVRLHSIEHVADLRFITMDYVDGTTIAQSLPEHGFPREVALTIAIPLANALSCMHREGIVHRDLKVSNLMWTRERELRILDFGVARLQGDSSESLTRTGDVLGTVATMAPEQLLGEKVDHRCDLFSFGALLAQLLTGKSPFQRATLAATIEAVLEEEAAVLAQEAAPLRTLIDRCLCRDPDRRPQSAAEIETSLREIAAAGAAQD